MQESCSFKAIWRSVSEFLDSTGNLVALCLGLPRHDFPCQILNCPSVRIRDYDSAVPEPFDILGSRHLLE